MYKKKRDPRAKLLFCLLNLLFVFFFTFALPSASLDLKGLFTWSGGLRSSGVGFFCFHALGDTKQKKPTPLDRGRPLHVNRVIKSLLKLGVHCGLGYWAIKFGVAFAGATTLATAPKTS